MRTSASYTLWSPCGWYLPSTSPTTVADFLYGRPGTSPSSFIAYSTRRWTGLRPSRTSGSARDTMTLIEELMNDSLISSSIRRGRMRSRLFGAVMTRLHSAGYTARILGDFPRLGIYPNGERKAMALDARKLLIHNDLQVAF